MPIVAPLADQQGQPPRQDTPQRNQESSRHWWNWFTDNGANWVIAFLTIVLAFIGGLQWWATHTANKHTAAVERAYIVLSHQTRLWGDQVIPMLARAIDIRGPSGASSPREVWFTIEIQNHGRTPADVLGGGVWIQTLPDAFPPPRPTPDIPAHYPVRLDPTFLVPNDNPSITSMIWQPTDVIARVEDGSECLWLIGHVDYKDRFGNGHRAGYGRHYDRYGRLLVFDETTAALNYDRPLTDADNRNREQALTHS